MNQFLQRIHNRVQSNFTIWDLGLLKTYGAIPGLLIGAYFPEFVITYLWVWVSFFIVLLLRYIYLLFFLKNTI